MLIQIKNIESSFHSFKDIGNFEKEPLRITICIYIILKKKVILIISHLWNQR